MLLKLFGSTAIIGACAAIGYLYSSECSRRPQELRMLQSMLNMFENEIKFLSDTITEAFQKISSASDCRTSVFFSGTARLLVENSGMGAAEAWNSTVRANIRMTALNREDEEIVASFGKMLGKSDLEGQIKNIRLTLNQLEVQEKKAEEHRKRNEVMYRTLGFLGGLAIVIILI